MPRSTTTAAAPAAAPALPPELAAVALIDAHTAAAAGSISTSQWRVLVAEGAAPAPAFRAPRCTRWRAVDVARFWGGYRPGPAAETKVQRIATNASAAAKRARNAKADGGAR